ncbi:PAS domain S-box protein [Halosolutus gelatinilyticus]|uniref:PAS domain S-box protein n=1 Tax=Halosolutus gelatinilyticus TaxID=2931975 RepID=UPI001FF5C915|nr:PAS domain S-box protein [Halosolutus gelatinilyticus]
MTERATDSGPPAHPAASETALRWYGTLAETVDGGVFHLDADGALVAVDESFAELIGDTRAGLLDDRRRSPFADRDLERIRRRLDDCERGGAAVAECDLALRAGDGTAVPCSVRVSRLETDGANRGTIGIARERAETPRKGIETPLDRSPASVPHSDSGTPLLDGALRSVFDDAAVGVFVLDDAFDVAWINETARRYFGLDREAVVGRDKRELIRDTLRRRIDGGEAFAETVFATDDDDNYVERFECHVTAGEDREERWLEYRSKPIESGPYAGGRVELYYDVTGRRRHAGRLQRLNRAVHEWLEGTTREEIAERACRHLVDVLGLDINGVFLADDAARALEPIAWSDRSEALFDELPTFEEGDGIAWRVFETGREEVYDDVTTEPAVYDPNTPIRSEIVLPIGDYGIIIAGSERRAAFGENDLTLARIAASSLEVTFDRLRHERRLERERAQTEKLLQTAPIAIAVEDASGETILSNRRADGVPGFPTWERAGSSTGTEEWDLLDDGGDPLDPAETPAARVRAIGEPVIDEELALDRRSASETRWYSVSAVPVYRPDGSLERVVSTGEEITHLKEHERRLERRKRELESELGEIFGRISDAVYALDEEWRFTHVNDRAAELLDRSRDELVGGNVWDMFPEAGESDLYEQYHEAMERQEPASFEYYSEPLGFWAQVNVYPSETGLSVYFRDVSERKARVRQLELSERRYRTLAEDFPNGIVVLYDDDLRYTLAAGQAFDEIPPSEPAVEGRRPTDVFPPETAAELETAYEAALDGDERTLEIEYADREWLVHAAPITADDGTVLNGLATAQDITEQKERERDLAKYETIVETMEDGVYALDGDGRFTTVNEAYAALTGHDREDLLGSHGSIVVDEAVMGLAEQIAADADRSTIETELETKTGDRVPIEATVTRATTVDDERERIGVVRDVTGRLERQRKLEASEERYRTLVENFPGGVVALFDDDLRYTAAGGRLIGDLGIDRETTIGRSISDHYPDDLADEVEPHFEAALRGEERSFEVAYRGRELLAHALPIEPAGEEHRGMLVVQDVTARREYQRKLETSNERLEQFAYAASHDIQEPLRMVTSYLQLLERRYADTLDEDAREFIDFAVDGADRMREMINGLLEYSRVESQGESFEPVDLSAVVDDVRTDLQLQIEESDAAIAAGPLPRASGDRGQLRQVFQNLLANAIEYSGDEPPRVEIAADRRGDEVVVSVRDEGIGIDPADADRIFDVFQRLHARGEYDGTGIGLALCHRIIERHQGDIWVESEPGAGSTFSFTLSAVDRDA